MNRCCSSISSVNQFDVWTASRQVVITNTYGACEMSRQATLTAWKPEISPTKFVRKSMYMSDSSDCRAVRAVVSLCSRTTRVECSWVKKHAEKITSSSVDSRPSHNRTHLTVPPLLYKQPAQRLVAKFGARPSLSRPICAACRNFRKAPAESSIAAVTLKKSSSHAGCEVSKVTSRKKPTCLRQRSDVHTAVTCCQGRATMAPLPALASSLLALASSPPCFSAKPSSVHARAKPASSRPCEKCPRLETW
mmetsp:Transcript_121131/g.339200  ORF Transcript_121131/g.339200 Transcript_121131/m.339200 type:complete len:249 (+) Transcript_121131:148-894(+)